MRRRRYTTAEQYREFMRRMMADHSRSWNVGDACMSYNLQEQTTIAAIDGDRVTLANGDQFHITHLRSANHLNVLR